ncbi:hypothetical protein L7F22_011356 [Adiantum nelumboides]|nr:hypothetical protein [Adiantum nelumboides]
MGESTDEDIVPPQDLLERLKDYGQEHCLDFWKDLTAEERGLLLKDLEVLDLPRINRIIKQSLYAQDTRSLASIEPVPEANISTLEHRTIEQREKWWNSGLKAIADGKLAVLLLSGGQFLAVRWRTYQAANNHKTLYTVIHERGTDNKLEQNWKEYSDI